MSGIDSDRYLSVIAPLWNDADILEPFVDELVAVLRKSFANFEVVLVDDGSSDDTVARVTGLMARYEPIRWIRLSRRFGQEIAIAAGLDAVIGDLVVVLLPDSDPPALVPQMVERALEGAEIVFGIRSSRKGEPLFLRLGAALFYWYCDRLLHLDLPKNSTHFRVMSRRVVNALIRIQDRGRYLRTLSQHIGYRSVGFPYELVQRRRVARTKSLFEAVDLAVNIVVTNSLRPLRMMSWLAAFLGAANGVAGVALFFVQGGDWSALQSGFSFALLFSILAVLCEYLGRAVDQSTGRPLYYVIEEKSGAMPVLDPDRGNVVTESQKS
jgi:dolichol-phosphate mannosyltransferase